MSSAMQPKHFQPGEGKTFKVGRMSMTFETTAGENGKAVTYCLPGGRASGIGCTLLLPSTYDDTFYHLRRTLRLSSGRQTVEAWRW